MQWTTAIATASGLALVTVDPAPGTVLGTAIAVNVCHAIVCGVIAGNSGYARWPWRALGFIGGVWAVAVLLCLPRRAGGPPPARPLP